MLRSIARPSLAHDLVELAEGGRITIGRDLQSHLKLECEEVPFLLSRRHAVLTFTDSQGGLTLTDSGSTNGSYAARMGQPLQKLISLVPWQLQDRDTIGFGGPEVIVAGPENSLLVHVPNPFLFKYNSVDELIGDVGGTQEAARSLSQESEQIPCHRALHSSPTMCQVRVQDVEGVCTDATQHNSTCHQPALL